MSDPIPLHSETKLDELKRLCQPMGGEPMRMVTRLELLALIECAEALKAYRNKSDWHDMKKAALAKLEAL